MKKALRQGFSFIALACAAALAPSPAAAATPRANAVLSRPLTNQPGDAARGRAIALDTNLGGCVLCHALPAADGTAVEPHGTLGPSLTDVGSRLNAAQLRQRIVDPTRIDGRVAMPGYYRTTNLQRVAPAYRGQTMLTAQQVEDVVSFLVSQK